EAAGGLVVVWPMQNLRQRTVLDARAAAPRVPPPMRPRQRRHRFGMERDAPLDDRRALAPRRADSGLPPIDRGTIRQPSPSDRQMERAGSRLPFNRLEQGAQDAANQSTRGRHHGHPPTWV